jgi:HEAT repeat protein
MPELVSRTGWFLVRPRLKPPAPLTIGLRVGVVILPGLLLLAGALRDPHWVLWLGSAFQGLVCFQCLSRRENWRYPPGGIVVLLYLMALGCLWWASVLIADWYLNLGHAVLLIVAIAALALQVLHDTGAPEMRRARLLAQRLTARGNWPADLAGCRALAEVQALREALHHDAAPALALLSDPRPGVRIAALAALGFRKQWGPNQAELVLEVARQAEVPAVRAAALYALANAHRRNVVEGLAEFLSDPSGEVRRAAADALLCDTDRRWPWIRNAVRNTLADTGLQEEGPLVHHGSLLGPEAVRDLTAWASHKGILALRAALTLKLHYRRALTEQPDEALVADLRKQLGDPHTPAGLRTDLAQLLQSHHLLDNELLEKLLDPLNPVPVRLVAAESLLATGEHEGAVAALRDIARLPNREIALATADVVQRRLGVDLGLALGEPLPPVHTRLAAEVTRRVMTWATGQDPLNILNN